MKKLLTVLLTLLMVITLVGCSSKQDTPVIQEPEKQEEVVEETKEEPEVVGGWTDAEDSTVTDELKDLFVKALDGLTGATYEPVKLLASQVVNGINYKFLANGTKTTNPVTKGTYYITIYKDLEGNVELLDIETIQEKQEEIKTADPAQYSYWVVTYDQFGNELSRTTAKYGTTVKDSDGKDVVVKGNTYFHTIIDYLTTKDDNESEEYVFNDSNPMTMSQMSEWFGENVDKAVKLNSDGKSYTITGGTEIVHWPLGDSEDPISYYIKSNQSLSIPSSIDGKPVTIISDNAFFNKTVSSITIPDSVHTIGKNAFYLCRCPENIIIPNSVTTICSFGFADCCEKIIYIPSSVTNIGTDAFYNQYVDNKSAQIAEGAKIEDAFLSNGFILCDNNTKAIKYVGEDTSATLPEGVETLCEIIDTSLNELTICSTLNKILRGRYDVTLHFGDNTSWTGRNGELITQGTYTSIEEALNGALGQSEFYSFDLIKVD